MASCEHGSYIPTGEKTAIYCPLCNPDYKSVGLRATPVPKRKRAPRRTVNVEPTPVYTTTPLPEAETDLV